MLHDKSLTQEKQEQILLAVKRGVHPQCVASEFHTNPCDVYQIMADAGVKEKKG